MTRIRVNLGFTGSYEIPDDPDEMEKWYGHTDLERALADDMTCAAMAIAEWCNDGMTDIDLTIEE